VLIFCFISRLEVKRFAHLRIWMYPLRASIWTKAKL